MLSFSKKHNSTMNLHHKLKSLEINLKKIVEISHITSKLDIMKDLRCSFKPQEMVKLKAFQEMDQKQKDFDVYRDFRGKIKIEDDKRFFISKIILREIKEKIQISKKIAIINMKIEKADERRRLNLDKTENLSKKGEKILQNLRETRRTSQKSKSEYSRKHLKMSSLTLLNKDLLPLKYNTEKYERKTIKLPVLKLLQK